LLRGGGRGPAIVPGNPVASILIQAVRQDGALTMPPGGKLSATDIATLTQWIKRGAPWGTKLRANDVTKIPWAEDPDKLGHIIRDLNTILRERTIVNI